MSITACDINLLMVFSLFLANIRVLTCFLFLFLVMLSNFLIIPLVREKIKVKFAFTFLTGAPTTLTEEYYKLHHLSQFLSLKLYLCNQKH